ncbi:MAG: radical SAM protein [Planctomycetes bacterium]|nr:radical SAM protein [Planctomycetota bacterium]
MPDNPLSLFTEHPRTYRENRFVYPVVSRRSRGLSLGVNLNPDKVCNFDCIYCQVDRTSLAETRFVEMERLLGELDAMFRFVASGRIYEDERFRNVPEQLRRLNDVAFSGDGEPTTFRNFDEIIESVAALKHRHRLPDVKLVLITNASMFHRPAVARGLKILDANNGEVWAKLDAGTEAYYHEVERTKIPFQQILDNITLAARLRPVVIQSLFLQIDDAPVSDAEIDAFCDRLNEIVAAGGRISLVQVYTVARKPAVSSVTALSDEHVDRIAASVRRRTGLPAHVYYAS